jgi:hypothetical protein
MQDDPFAPPRADTLPPPTPPAVQRRRKQRTVAGLLFSGGLWGVALCLWPSFRVQGLLSLQLPVVLVAPFILAILAGVWLWRGLRRGLIWARVLLVAQLVAVRWNQSQYSFSTGANAFVGFSGSNFVLSWHLGSNFNLGAVGPPGPGFIGLNLVAIVALVLLASGDQPPL